MTLGQERERASSGGEMRQRERGEGGRMEEEEEDRSDTVIGWKAGIVGSTRGKISCGPFPEQYDRSLTF